MGSLEFQCTCGFGFRNSTDHRSYVADLLPDQDRDAFWDLIDAAVENSGPSARNKEQACMDLRASLFRARQQAWQCNQCGRLYLTDASGKAYGIYFRYEDTDRLASRSWCDFNTSAMKCDRILKQAEYCPCSHT